MQFFVRLLYCPFVGIYLQFNQGGTCSYIQCFGHLAVCVAYNVSGQKGDFEAFLGCDKGLLTLEQHLILAASP